jgi:hypothetical protein
MYFVWTSLKIFCQRDMALFAFHDDQQLDSLSTRNTSMFLDTTTNSIVYEPQTVLASRIDDILLTH